MWMIRNDYNDNGGLYYPSFAPDIHDDKDLWLQFVSYFPFKEMTSAYALSEALEEEFRNHLALSIYYPISQGSSIHLGPLDASRRKFDAWMRSTRDYSSFDQVNLSQIAEGCGEFRASFLVPDMVCTSCCNREPFFAFCGTDEDQLEWEPKYLNIKNKAFDMPLLKYFPETRCCYYCDPEHWPNTYRLSRFARFRLGQCECMPCKRGY